jgi:hypothetical protein
VALLVLILQTALPARRRLMRASITRYLGDGREVERGGQGRLRL